MIDFTLTPAQQTLLTNIRGFASQHLANARSLYNPDLPPSKWQDRFRATLPIYRAAVSAGLIKAHIPAPLGGLGGSLLDNALVMEEMYFVDTSASLTIAGTGLGLLPLVMAGTPELHKRFFAPFLSGEGQPLASFVFSEPQGSANFGDPDGEGMQTIAREAGDSYVLGGEKIWATNSGGWDDRGADLQCVVCRIPSCEGNAREQVAIIIVTREDIANNDPAAYQVLSHPETVGHTAVNGPHIRFSSLRVPKSQLLAPPGRGADTVETVFTATAALVGAMGVGVMRRSFEAALNWAKANQRGSKEAMLNKQSVADLLIKIKTRCETTRSLCWRAASAFGTTKYAGELCYQTKIYGSESAVGSVMDAINLVGVSAYSREYPFGDLLQDALVLPIFDGGNIGVRRRQIESIFKQDDYDPWESTFGRKEETNVDGH